MKFWLACFVLLFIGAELFQWVAELGSLQASGSWLILGGIGLAAASNAAHLPSMKGQAKPLDSAEAENVMLADHDKNANANKAAEKIELQTQAIKAKSTSRSIAEQSAEDSISFKVRFPWR